MRSVVYLLAAGVLCATGALRAETKQERGKRVVDEALAAIGGEKYLAMTDRVESGRAYSFYRDQLTGLSVAKIYTRYLNAPAASGLAVRERQSFGKDEDYYVLFTDAGGYVITFRGARPMPKDRYTRWSDSTRRNILYILRHRLKEPGLIFESQGTTVWQNTPVEIVDVTDADNNVVTVFFQMSNKLPVRQVFVRRDPITKERFEEVSVFAKYRDVGGGVQWPYNITAFRNGGKVYEIFSDDVKINTGLSDNQFTLSTNMKVLPPEK
ncbi:MAG TPA: hypothetical protein VER03_03030 [Bryobacteraceae bacterium]|nr:hypothetical protein [Bryobacteraceae bacterium]